MATVATIAFGINRLIWQSRRNAHPNGTTNDLIPSVNVVDNYNGRQASFVRFLSLKHGLTQRYAVEMSRDHVTGSVACQCHRCRHPTNPIRVC